MRDPCAFSPPTPEAQNAAQLYSGMFSPGGLVLELGFGQGHFLDAATARGIRVIGIDRDSALVEDAQARGHDVREGDVRDIASLVSEPVDGVLAAHLVEHLWPNEVQEVFRSLGSVVSPGGAVVIVTPNVRDWRVMSEWFWLDPTHVRPYPPGAIQQLIDPAVWAWEAQGYEPFLIAKRAQPRIFLERLRFGRNYARPGRWYRLRRTSSGSPPAAS